MTDPHLFAATRPHGIESVASHLALLTASAVLMSLVFPQPGWWPLAWVALVPAGVLAVRSARPLRLLWTSYVVFLVWWMLRITWIWPVTPGGYVGLCAALAAYWSVGLVLLQLLHRAYPLPMVLLLPMVWVSVEFLRGTLPLGGFNWFQLGHALGAYLPTHGPSRIGQTADLFGEWTVTFIVCMTNGVVVDMLTRPWFAVAATSGAAARRGAMRRSMRAALILWSLTLSAAWFYGQYRITETQEVTGEASAGVAVAVVQTNVPQDNKNAPSRGEEEEWWRQMLDLTRQAAQATPKPALIAWPETMVPAAINPEAAEAYAAQAMNYAQVTPADLRNSFDSTVYERIATDAGIELDDVPAYLSERFARKVRYRQEIADLVRELGITLIAGAAADHIRDQRYNSAYLYYSDGLQSPQRYDKIHLVPFGEYIPWISEYGSLKQLFLDYLSPYPYDYSLTRGQAYSLFTIEAPVAGQPDEMQPLTFGTPICFEDVVPRICREMIYEGTGGSIEGKPGQMLVNITNDGWFAGSAQPLQQMQIATFRTIENRVPMARAVNTGVSGFIDSAGRVLSLVEVEGATLQVAGYASQELRLDPRQTLFGALGRIPVTLLLVVTLVLAAAAPLRLRAHRRGG